jgi:hypothetical protein
MSSTIKESKKSLDGVESSATDAPEVNTNPVNPYAVVSLAAGIAALCGLGIPAAVIAIVHGNLALAGIKRTAERGRGSAVFGMVAGYLALLLGLIFFVVVMATTVAIVQSFPQMLESFTESLTQSVTDSATENLMGSMPTP